MLEYFEAIIYILIGLIGALFHYLKKRYVDKTTCCDLKTYLLGEPAATINALLSIIAAEVGLSIANAWPIALSAFVGALTAGYTVDSSINKAPK